MSSILTGVTNLREWRNRQTRMIQDHVGFGPVQVEDLFKKQGFKGTAVNRAPVESESCAPTKPQRESSPVSRTNLTR